MSFWGGVAKGLEAGEAKREREQAREDQRGARQEAKDWQQKMFDYKVKQDEAAASAAANQLSFKNSIAVLDLMGTTAKNGSGAPKSAGKPKQSLEASLNILKANGASDEVLSSFAGHGALALSKAVDAWGVYQAEVKDRPSGTVRTIDDFLTTAVTTTSPGVEPDMAEAARVMGIPEEALDEPMYKGTGYTWRDAINKKLGKESVTEVYFGPTGTTPAVFDPAQAVKQANASVDGVLKAQISQNNETLSSLEVGTDQYKAVSAENARISQAMEAMKEGRPTEAIRLVGANAVLPMLSNTPGSLAYNLGGGWDQAIDNVTFTNTEEYANAFAKGAVGVGDWVVVDGSILLIKEPPAVDSAVVEPKVGTTAVVEPFDLTGNTFTTAQMNSLTEEEYTTLAKNNPFILVDGKRIESPLYSVEEPIYTKRLDSKGEGFTMPEVAAEGVTTALLAGNKTRDALATIVESVNPDGELSASYLNATDTMTSALNRGAANAADFIYGVMGGTEQTNIAEWLRADADRIDAKPEVTAESVRKKNLQIAEAYVDGMNSWFGGLFSTETKVEATENVANVLTRGSDTPAAKALLETIQERVDYARSKRKEKPTSPQVTEEGLMSKRLDDTNRRIAEEDMAMSRPVPQPLGTIAFNGPTAGDDTNKRIAEEDAAMNVDFPQPLDAVTFNGPTAEDGLMSMPVEQAGGFAEVMQSLATASDEEKSVILSKYIGEDGLPIRKPDYAGGRLADTNKRIAEEDAAMAVDFPQPLKDIVLKARSSGEEKFQPATMAATELNTPVIQKALSIVSTVVGPEVAAVLATGFQPDTLGSPELNTPAIQQALTVVGEKVDPEVAAIIAVGFKPATMGATELNTPAVREAIANVPTEVKEAVEAIITTGNESDIEQAASEVAAEFGESVAAILFDDLKSARGTGKSAMMSGLQ